MRVHAYARHGRGLRRLGQAIMRVAFKRILDTNVSRAVPGSEVVYRLEAGQRT